MTKFKFGDKVWHKGLFGNGIYYKPSYHGSDEPMCYVLSENYGLKVVEVSSITKVSAWIPCSERMPDIDVEVLVYFDGYIYIDSLYYDKNLKEYWWQGNDRLPTHWMQLPDMPEVKE